jgi:hypothetical protein
MSGIMSMLLGAVSSAVAATDAFFNRVTLLLNTSSTNGAQNNTFLDSSSNNFTITRNGNTTQGTFTPFSQTGWGNYFDGGSSLSVSPNAAFTFGTGDFTVEGWIYSTAASSTANGGFQQGTSFPQGNTTNTVAFATVNSGQVWQIYAKNTSASSTATWVANTWYHFAVVRSGTTTSLYINGTSVITVTSDSTNYTGTYFGVGQVYSGIGYHSGYISNVRVVKGTAVYTSAFTPPTTPLTAITNTSLLTCQSNRFVDNSTNAFAITVGGSPSVQAFSPFAPTAAYDAAVVGGSGYFDGTGDYLSIADNSLLEPGSSTFTLECWFYSTAAPPGNGAVILSKSATSSFGPFAILIDPSTKYINGLASTTGSSWNISISSTTVAALNTWYHVALVRSGSNFALFINGTRSATTTNAGTLINNTDAFMVGYDNYASTNFTGYVSSVRYVVGTAVYDPTLTTCTIPTAPANPSGSTLCINYTNSGIYDAAAKNVLETVGNAQVSTTQAKFGTTSMYFDGAGDYLYSPVSSSNILGNTWTIEFWYQPTSRATTYPAIICISDSNSNYANTISIFDRHQSATTKFSFCVANAGTISSGTTNVSNGTWYHIALVSNNGSNTLYINGTSEATSSTTTGSANKAIFVGINFDFATYSSAINGYIDELRITKGVARYTTNFTAPTAAFPIQ